MREVCEITFESIIIISPTMFAEVGMLAFALASVRVPTAAIEDPAGVYGVNQIN